MGYAFISYSTRNQSLADAMRDLLKDCGIETWMAPGDIPAGSKYAQVINRAVKNCSCFVLMLSEDAQNSVWVAKEVERAVNYRRPIIPVQLENVVLNDEFELYISTDQVVAIQKIDKDTQEIKSLLSSIRNFVGEPELDADKDNVISKKDGSPQNKAKNIELTIWSPVNTDVFLNDKNHLVMRIDHNSGFDYKFNSINVSGSFNLIFVANGFEKTILFDSATIEDKLEYRLQAILSKKEIHDSYNREEAIEQIEIDPTAYAFEQLSEKGISEDVDLLISTLMNLTSKNTSDGQHDNYLIATCAKALGKLAVKYKRLDDIVFVLDVYENYEAKSSYGWMFDSIVKFLQNNHYRASGNPKLDGAASSIQNKKAIVDGQIAAIQKRYPKYSDVQFCDSSLGSVIYRAFDSENNIEVAIKIYSPEAAFHIPFFSDGGLFWDIKELQADNLCPFIERQLSEPICLIMRYVQGETLEAHIKSAWLWNDNVESILGFSLGILNGLNALHSINIYYGDLTPRNIVVDKNNVPWLCDFSESNYNGSRYIDKTVLIEKYRSPEKSPGNSIDYRSDIYEFGVILSDFLPFIRNDDSTRDALFEIVKKATKENPDERYQSANEIIVEINSLLNSDLPKTSNDGVPFEEIFGELSESGTETSVLLAEVPLSDNCDTAVLLTDNKNDNKRERQQGESTVGLKLKGHLVNSYRRIQDITAEQCGNPIGINMPDGTTRIVDLCDTFAISQQKTYMVAKQKENEECLFFVFRAKNNKINLVSEGKDQQKVYQLFREKYAEQYVFTDETLIVNKQKNQKKKKHFAQDTAVKLYPTLNSIPQIFAVPEKYSYIQPNVFAKLNPNGYRIRQIIIPESIEKICENAFQGLIITEMVYIPNSVKSIGDKAFTLTKNAFVYCKEASFACKHFSRGNYTIIRDIPFEPHGNSAESILTELYHNRTATRIKGRTIPFSLEAEIDSVIIPDNICVMDDYALYYAQIQKKIVIPPSVKKIGKSSFNLATNAYVECEQDSFAYLYCSTNGIKNSVDMAIKYRAKGVCAYCGSRFSGLFNKKCSVCGKPKDY